MDLIELIFICLQEIFCGFVDEIFVFEDEGLVGESNGDSLMDGFMDLIIDICVEVCVNKDWGIFDKICDVLQEVGIVFKDSKEGMSWMKVQYFQFIFIIMALQLISNCRAIQFDQGQGMFYFGI